MVSAVRWPHLGQVTVDRVAAAKSPPGLLPSPESYRKCGVGESRAGRRLLFRTRYTMRELAAKGEDAHAGAPIAVVRQGVGYDSRDQTCTLLPWSVPFSVAGASTRLSVSEALDLLSGMRWRGATMRVLSRLVGCLIALCVVVVGGVALATDAIQCGTDLVAVGDSEYDLVRKCGEPAYRNGNQWTYDQGPDSLLKIVTVGNGRVISIHVGERAD